MADDFLKKVDTRGMTVDDLKQLLGNPDVEQDSWSYNLSVKGAPPPVALSMEDSLAYPHLYVNFRKGRVDSLSVTDGLELSEELPFNPTLWKVSKPSDRLRMTANLWSSEKLFGLSNEEVQQLIGDPDGKGQNQEIEYYLGYRMIDLVTLTFALNGAGEVTDAKVIEH